MAQEEVFGTPAELELDATPGLRVPSWIDRKRGRGPQSTIQVDVRLLFAGDPPRLRREVVVFRDGVKQRRFERGSRRKLILAFLIDGVERTRKTLPRSEEIHFEFRGVSTGQHNITVSVVGTALTESRPVDVPPPRPARVPGSLRLDLSVSHGLRAQRRWMQKRTTGFIRATASVTDDQHRPVDDVQIQFLLNLHEDGDPNQVDSNGEVDVDFTHLPLGRHIVTAQVLGTSLTESRRVDIVLPSTQTVTVAPTGAGGQTVAQASNSRPKVGCLGNIIMFLVDLAIAWFAIYYLGGATLDLLPVLTPETPQQQYLYDQTLSFIINGLIVVGVALVIAIPLSIYVWVDEFKLVAWKIRTLLGTTSGGREPSLAHQVLIESLANQLAKILARFRLTRWFFR